ncbi:MAG TPA: acyl-CoA dehydrogenase family protein, partial [Candidatus Sulfopaludibacter sp.]|nr:acyl-CoA dehydrogenase family protein [Candidatus Sulfopaludibacter sp.]
RNRDVVRVVEQLAGIDLTLALFVGNHNALGLRPIQQFGRPELRSRLLPRLAQGRELASFALTEPGAGSNPRAIAAKATRDAKGGWRLNGTKLWIGSASWAGVINVFARISDASPELSGTAAFAVPQGAQGLRHGPEALTMGMRGMVQNAIYLNDVFLSDDHQLGESGAGLDIAQDAMMFGRLGLGATAAGGIKRCAQLMLRYAGRRSISTGRLLDNPVTLSRLTSTVAAADAVGRLVYRTAEFLDQGLRVPNEVLLVSKIAGTEYLWRAADDLVQLLGARGYLENNIAAQLLRDARVFRIFEGPTETLQSFLGASVLHGSAELHRFLAETLNAPDVVERLRAAVERIQANDADRADSFEDRTAMQRWTHYRAGSLACLAILLAFARAPEEAPAARGRRTEEWLESQFRHELAGAIEAGQPFPLRPDDLNRVVGGYADSIGDIEQSLPGEDQALDWLLRREAPAPPKQARPLLVAKSPVEPVKPAPNQSAALVSPDSAPGRRPTQSDIEKWLRAWLVREARVPAAMVAANRPFVDFGLDSTTAIMLIADLEDFLGTRFETTLAWDYPTISSLAAFVASRTRSEDRHES